MSVFCETTASQGFRGEVSRTISKWRMRKSVERRSAVTANIAKSHATFRRRLESSAFPRTKGIRCDVTASHKNMWSGVPVVDPLGKKNENATFESWAQVPILNSGKENSTPSRSWFPIVSENYFLTPDSDFWPKYCKSTRKWLINERVFINLLHIERLSGTRFGRFGFTGSNEHNYFRALCNCRGFLPR